MDMFDNQMLVANTEDQAYKQLSMAGVEGVPTHHPYRRVLKTACLDLHAVLCIASKLQHSLLHFYNDLCHFLPQQFWFAIVQRLRSVDEVQA